MDKNIGIINHIIEHIENIYWHEKLRKYYEHWAKHTQG